MKKITLLLVLVGLCFAYHLNAQLFGNRSDDAFESPKATESVTISGAGTTIHELIVIGGASFLRGCSDVNSLSENVELMGVGQNDWGSIRANIKSGMDNMAEAWYDYKKLVDISNQSSYNQIVLNKLAAFDYKSFAAKNNLNPHVMNSVEAFLKRGDVRGVYVKIKNDIAEIYYLLDELEMYAIYENAPPAKLMWGVGDKVASTFLFGQYVARVFYEIN